ncbi:L,D-transpeptidase-like protein [Palleronia aestuarii]|uniref:L,D-transpeptidase-like protein n=1 Tax=Palleronia aestuarii TaxID=568105 RepID=A0A2W7NEU5_9RHOB|nr:L,D-transpeptidase family protein [Palleronia aestuarii]PZX18945.1 L,D-transpeptidase-like protein [Palleronia aestuarii]
MTILRALLCALALLTLAGCATKFRGYDGPQVTRVLLFKNDRRLHLLHGNTILESYDVGLGFAPEGHKQFEGDGRTPEGHYFIDKRNPNSSFHLSIGISYPNRVDVARATAMGKRPGGNIFIHGRGPSYQKGAPRDWTFGCVAVTDRQMEDIYAMVSDGTPISIYP